MTVDEKTKELVKRLRERTVLVNYGNGNVGDVPDTDCNNAALALEALAGEVERLNRLNDELDTAASERLLRAFAAEAERDRLKAALEAIAVKAGTSECGGNYVAAVSLIGDLEQMADAALRAAGDGR